MGWFDAGAKKAQQKERDRQHKHFMRVLREQKEWLMKSNPFLNSHYVMLKSDEERILKLLPEGYSGRFEWKADGSKSYKFVIAKDGQEVSASVCWDHIHGLGDNHIVLYYMDPLISQLLEIHKEKAKMTARMFGRSEAEIMVAIEFYDHHKQKEAIKPYLKKAMTREEAIEKHASATNVPEMEYFSDTKDKSAMFIKGLEALGIIKFDEVKREADPEAYDLMRYERQDIGVIRIAKWPEGLVLWVNGEIKWKSWNTDAKPEKAPTFEEAVQGIMKANENSPYEFHRTRGYAEAYVRGSIAIGEIAVRRAQESELDKAVKEAKIVCSHGKMIEVSHTQTQGLISIISKLLAALQQKTKVVG